MPSTPQHFNALHIVNKAFEDVGAKGAVDTLSPADAQDGLVRLNNMVSGWNISQLTWPFVARTVFPTVTSQSTYTVGPGGDFDMARPARLEGAGLLLPATGPGVAQVEIPRSVITDDAYEAIQIKDLPSGLWTLVYYNPTYAGGLGSVFLWPTPDNNQNGCVLYAGSAIQQFADLTTFYDFPPGAADACEYGLAERLLAPYGRVNSDVRQDIKQNAWRYLSNFKTAGYKPADVQLDPMWTNDRRTNYNIQTGTGG